VHEWLTAWKAASDASKVTSESFASKTASKSWKVPGLTSTSATTVFPAMKARVRWRTWEPDKSCDDHQGNPTSLFISSPSE
jgi:hypothetical protein